MRYAFQAFNQSDRVCDGVGDKHRKIAASWFRREETVQRFYEVKASPE